MAPWSSMVFPWSVYSNAGGIRRHPEASGSWTLKLMEFALCVTNCFYGLRGGIGIDLVSGSLFGCPVNLAFLNSPSKAPRHA